MRTLTGIGVSPGSAIGPVAIVRPPQPLPAAEPCSADPQQDLAKVTDSLLAEMGDQAAFIGIAADTDGNVKKFTAKNPGIDFPLVLAGYNALNLSRQ